MSVQSLLRGFMLTKHPLIRVDFVKDTPIMEIRKFLVGLVPIPCDLSNEIVSLLLDL